MEHDAGNPTTRSTPHPPARSAAPHPAASVVQRWWHALLTAAAATMITIGTAQVLAGTFAILEGEVFAIESGTLYKADATIGGWIQVVLGGLLLLAGAVGIAQRGRACSTVSHPRPPPPSCPS